ncbi:MAG: hypothetical protein WCQ50_07975 [Spirochaetota bacterium]|jgi:hypothetical protein
MLISALFAPGAGRSERFLELGQTLLRRSGGHSLVACPGNLGGDYLPGARLLEPLAQAANYVESIRVATLALMDEHPDILVCVGGDGLASYVADTVRGSMGEGGKLSDCALLGVAAGTINVGPIVTLGPEGLEDLDLSRLVIAPVGAVEARVDGRHLAWGFNDIVIGTTFLGTVDGELACLSAEAMVLHGMKVVEEPQDEMTTEAFRVLKDGVVMEGGLRRPAQIVASPLARREFYARAVTGVLCEAGWKDDLAALALLDSVLVKTGALSSGEHGFARVDHLLFSPGEAMAVEGLSPKAYLMADGNPHELGGGRLELFRVARVVNVARVGSCPTGRA